MRKTPAASTSRGWVHLFAVLTATSCFVLLFVGGLVTSHDAGLSVPDWPNSYGWNMFTFPIKNWVGNIFYEHTHRLFASVVGTLILIQAIILQFREPRAWVRQLGWAALAGVVLQGVLGGITVLMYLPPAVSSAHAGLAQAVFCLSLAIAIVTNKGWNDEIVKRHEAPGTSLRTLSVVTVAAIFLQLIIGAVMRHTFSGLAIPTFPLAPDGSLIPAFSTFGVAINFTHRVGAVTVSVLVLWCVTLVITKYSNVPSLRRLALLAIVLLITQVTLGAITIWSAKAVTPTTLHVSCGAALLGTMVALAIRGRHLLSSAVQRSEVIAEPTSAFAGH